MNKKNTAAPAEQPIGSSVSGFDKLIIPENSMECLNFVARMFAGEVVFLRLKGYSAANKETVQAKRYQTAKMPIDKEWTSTQFDVRTFDELAKWIDGGGWIGMRVPDDYIVVDVDNAHEGRVIAELLKHQNVTHHLLKTPNGYQFIFKDAGSVQKQNVKMFTECGFEVDYRLQKRGQIVIPTPNTEGRGWLHAEQADVQEMPYWFTPVKQVNDKNERPFIVPIGEGSRNTMLYQHACRLKKMARNEDQIFKAIAFIGTHLCLPSVDSSEIESTVASALRHNDDVIDLSKRRDNVVPHPAMTRKDNVDAPEQHDRKFGKTDLANAQRLVHYFGSDLKYCYQFGSWYIWDGKRWRRDDTGEIERKAKATVRNIYQEALEEDDDKRISLMKHGTKSESAQSLTNLIKLARSEEGVPITPNQMDGNDWLLNCKNGVIDLKTGMLLPHNRADLITNLIPTSYDSEADCPNWKNFLNRIMQDEQGNVRTELVDFLQKAVGYSLTGSIKEQAMFFLYGSGKNGKSTFINTIKDLLGDYGRQSGTETFMMKQQQSAANNDIARLKGARFVSAVESEEGKRLAESLIKQLTGGEPMTARFLHQEHFEFTPAFKIFFVTNHRPQIRGTDPAIWRRIRMIPFTVTITAAEDDKSLPEKLRDEMPGILRWAVEGCLKWQGQGLGAPDEVMNATQEYREEMDTLSHFIDEYCVIDPTAKVSSKDLYKAYQEWSEETGEYVHAKNKFIARLKDRLEATGVQIKDYRTNAMRGYEGIGLSSNPIYGNLVTSFVMKKAPTPALASAARKPVFEQGEL